MARQERAQGQRIQVSAYPPPCGEGLGVGVLQNRAARGEAVWLAVWPCFPLLPLAGEGGRRPDEGVTAGTMITRIIEPKRLGQARRLRRNQTPAEIRLWSGLRGRRLQDYKFVRQHSVGPFT